MHIRCLTFLILLEVLCFSSGYIFIKEINIHNSKENGKPWDSFSGEPDVECYVFIFHEGVWKKKYTSTKYSDSTKISDILETQIAVTEESKIKIEIVDVDISGNDMIGTIDIVISEKDYLHDQEISFGRVEKLVYAIIPYKTMKEKEKADSIAEEVKSYKEKTDKIIEDHLKKIQELEKIIEQKNKMIEEYKKNIESLEKEIKKNPIKNEEEFWNEFEKDLKGK